MRGGLRCWRAGAVGRRVARAVSSVCGVSRRRSAATFPLLCAAQGGSCDAVRSWGEGTGCGDAAPSRPPLLQITATETSTVKASSADKPGVQSLS